MSALNRFRAPCPAPAPAWRLLHLLAMALAGGAVGVLAKWADFSSVPQLVEDYGIMASAAVAEQAIPSCNVTYIDGEEMRAMVSAYLQVLYDLDPASVGGTLPGDDFYYLG